MVTEFFGVSDSFWFQYGSGPAFNLQAGPRAESMWILIMNSLYRHTNIEISNLKFIQFSDTGPRNRF